MRGKRPVRVVKKRVIRDEKGMQSTFDGVIPATIRQEDSKGRPSMVGRIGYFSRHLKRTLPTDKVNFRIYIKTLCLPIRRV